MSRLGRGATALAALPALWCTAPSPAHAYHDPETPVVFYGADTLQAQEFQLGLFRFGYGITDDLYLSTLTLPWALKVASLDLKYRFWSQGPWSVAARLGLTYLDFQRLSEDSAPATFAAVPFSLVGSYRAGNFTYSLSATYTYTRIEGEASDEDVDAFGAVDTALATAAVEWRWSRTFALILTASGKLHERVDRVESTIQLDPDTSLFVASEIGVDRGPLGNLVASALWSWEYFNLQLGLGYGHYLVPVVNVFISEPIYIPELDLFWRF